MGPEDKHNGVLASAKGSEKTREEEVSSAVAGSVVRAAKRPPLPTKNPTRTHSGSQKEKGKSSDRLNRLTIHIEEGPPLDKR
jgi:hypothetical protein